LNLQTGAKESEGLLNDKILKLGHQIDGYSVWTVTSNGNRYRLLVYKYRKHIFYELVDDDVGENTLHE
jgi:hypothetical protein